VSAVTPHRPALAWLLGAALFGGLIGGVVVGLVGGFLGPSAPNSAAGSCVGSQVAANVLPSIVTIRAITPQGGGNGTGELIRPGGYVLTNDHVISSAVGPDGRLVVQYTDGTTSDATLVGRDPATDLAVIKAADGAAGRPLIALGSSGSLLVGQPVIALGAPLGLYSTVTHGIVSALDRYVPVPGANGVTHHLIDAIQTDASINPGNSGGALVDCAGRLVGVNSAIITVPNAQGVSGGGSVGLGFAIPVDLADPLAQELIDHGQASHPTFGLEAQTILPTPGSSAAVPFGLYVSAVDAGGPAATAGLQVGDIITAVDGQAARSVAVLERAALTRQPGTAVPITYFRDGATKTVPVVLAPGS
jgi:putative serine protease PepD